MRTIERRFGEPMEINRVESELRQLIIEWESSQDELVREQIIEKMRISDIETWKKDLQHEEDLEKGTQGGFGNWTDVQKSQIKSKW